MNLVNRQLQKYVTARVLYFASILEIALCSALLGGGTLGLLLSFTAPVRGQSNPFSVDNQLAQHNVQLSQIDVSLAEAKLTIEILERERVTMNAKINTNAEQIGNLRDEVSLIHGIGIAVGSILLILTFLQLWFSKFSKQTDDASRLYDHREHFIEHANREKDD